MSDTFTDTGWSGTPAAVTGAIAGYGYQVNSDGSVSVIDPTLAGPVLAVAGYRVLDGVAYVLVRSSAPVPLPDGIASVGPDHTSALSGVFMPDGTAAPLTISSADWFNRFTPTELNNAWALAVSQPASGLGGGMIAALAAGSLNLTNPRVIETAQGLVQAGILTAERAATMLTP